MKQFPKVSSDFQRCIKKFSKQVEASFITRDNAALADDLRFIRRLNGETNAQKIQLALRCLYRIGRADGLCARRLLNLLVEEISKGGAL
jgi:hypothetical protein